MIISCNFEWSRWISSTTFFPSIDWKILTMSALPFSFLRGIGYQSFFLGFTQTEIKSYFFCCLKFLSILFLQFSFWLFVNLLNIVSASTVNDGVLSPLDLERFFLAWFFEFALGILDLDLGLDLERMDCDKLWLRVTLGVLLASIFSTFHVTL